MREFKVDIKGEIKYNGKIYNVTTDKVTMLRIMTSCVAAIEELQGKIGELHEALLSNEASMDEYLEKGERYLQDIYNKQRMLCSLALGYKNYLEIEKTAGTLSFDDVSNLCEIVVEELKEVCDKKNASFKERVTKLD